MRNRAISVARTPAAIAAAALTLTAAVVTLTLRSAGPEDRVVSAVVHALLVLVPVGTGLAVLRRRPDDRFARLLVTAGLLWSTVALAESSNAWLYSTGRLAVWVVVEPAVVYLLLAFPTGRLTTTLERAAFAAVALVSALLYVPTALLTDRFPEPNPFASCGVACPRNVFEVVAAEPGFVDAAVRPVREVLTVGLYLLVTAILVR